MSVAELDELVELAAAIVATPASWSQQQQQQQQQPPPPLQQRAYSCKLSVEDHSIWWHREASSASEPGLQAIICLQDRPINLVPSLGLPLQESYRHCVFLQRTEGPGQMFGRWRDEEARDEQDVAVAPDPYNFNRRTLRLALGDYLDLMTVLQEEWPAVDSEMMATIRQLACVDQPVPLSPKFRARGHGSLHYRRDVGPLLSIKVSINSRSIGRGGGGSSGSEIQVQLEAFEGGRSGPIRKMTVPLSSLTALVSSAEDQAVIHDLRQRWRSSLEEEKEEERAAAAAAAGRGRKRKREAVNHRHSSSPLPPLFSPAPTPPDFMDQATAAVAAAVAGGSGSDSHSLSGREKTARQRRQDWPEQCGNSKDPRQHKQQKRSSGKDYRSASGSRHRSNSNSSSNSNYNNK